MSLIKELKHDKIKINWNKKPILMEKFLSFLIIPVERSTSHLGSDMGWTKYFNEEHQLIVGGGRVPGHDHYLDTLQFGTKLQNVYNNYVNPFYLFDILNQEGKEFFSEYYKEDILKLVEEQNHKVVSAENNLMTQKEKLKSLEKEADYYLESIRN